METQTTQHAQKPKVKNWSRKQAWVAVAVVGLTGTLLGGTAMVTGARHMWGYSCDHRFAYSRSSIEHVQDVAKLILDEIGATETQQEKVERILEDVVGDLQDLTDRLHRNERPLHEPFKAPVIDRGVMEAIRKDEIWLADGASRLILQALAELEEVLSPEQRHELMRHTKSHQP